MPKPPAAPAPKTAAAKKTVTNKTPAVPVASKPVRKDLKDRPAIYETKSCRILEGDKALTEDQAKKLLGWYEVGSDTECLFTDMEGKRIQCSNNVGNRPFTLANALGICQSHLKRRWKLNGENLIIGRTGLTVSAQHRLAGFIFACQKYRADPSKYPEWSEPPTMETYIAFGVSEDDETVNTIDTGKSRSVAEIIFRSESFADLSKQARKEASKLTEHAIRFIWDRLGIAAAFSVIKTPAESVAFLAAHPKLLECVRHVYDENGGKEGRLNKYMSPGYCSALFFLMACSTSDAAKYRAASSPNQEYLSWDNFDKAETFITLLASGVKEFVAIGQAIGALYGSSAAGGTKEEKTAILVKAWNRYVEGNPISAASLKLEYTTDEEGVKTLVDYPTIGGLDVGSVEDAQDATDAIADEVENDPEVGQPLNDTDRLKGAKVWIKEKPPGAHWWGYLDSVYTDVKKGKLAKIKVPKGLAGAGNLIAVNYAALCDEEPK